MPAYSILAFGSPRWTTKLQTRDGGMGGASQLQPTGSLKGAEKGLEKSRPRKRVDRLGQ